MGVQNNPIHTRVLQTGLSFASPRTQTPDLVPFVSKVSPGWFLREKGLLNESVPKKECFLGRPLNLQLRKTRPFTVISITTTSFLDSRPGVWKKIKTRFIRDTLSLFSSRLFFHVCSTGKEPRRRTPVTFRLT
jgi:hypothetical protein